MEDDVDHPTGLSIKGWPRFRHDNRNSGSTPAIVGTMPTLQWKKGPFGTTLNSGKAMASGPVIARDGTIIVGGGDNDGMQGVLWALNGAGSTQWTFAGKRGYGYAQPAIRVDGTSYYSTQDGTAYAVDSTGLKKWNYSFGSQDDCSPIVTRDGLVIYGSDTGELFTLDADGKLKWQSDKATGPGEVDAALAESCEGLIVAGGQNGWVGLNAKTGKTQWKVAATGGLHALMSSPLVSAAGIVYGADSGGQVVAIDLQGKLLWSKQVASGGGGTSLAKIGPQLFVVLADGKLHALNAATGQENWAKPVGQQAEMYRHGGPVVDGAQRIYFNSSDGYVYAFDTAGTPLWKLAASGQSLSGTSFAEMAIADDGTLLVPGNDGLLYAFQ